MTKKTEKRKEERKEKRREYERERGLNRKTTVRGNGATNKNRPNTGEKKRKPFHHRLDGE